MTRADLPSAPFAHRPPGDDAHAPDDRALAQHRDFIWSLLQGGSGGEAFEAQLCYRCVANLLRETQACTELLDRHLRISQEELDGPKASYQHSGRCLRIARCHEMNPLVRRLLTTTSLPSIATYQPDNYWRQAQRLVASHFEFNNPIQSKREPLP